MPQPLRLRYFTPREANELLPEVAARVTEASEAARRLRELTEAVRSEDAPLGDERRDTVREIDQLRDALRTHVEAISERGVEVKRLLPPLLDFPCLRNGVEVYLCWKNGEASVDHWHPLHTGLAGRQPIIDPDSGVWEWCN